jgi:hypothetical protein
VTFDIYNGSTYETISVGDNELVRIVWIISFENSIVSLVQKGATNTGDDVYVRMFVADGKSHSEEAYSLDQDGVRVTTAIADGKKVSDGKPAPTLYRCGD